MQTILLQSASDIDNRPSKESRAIRMAAMLMDGIRVMNTSAKELDKHKNELLAGAMPVGSVEFVRRAFHVIGVQEPPNISYPPGCESHLHRKVEQTTAHQVVYGVGAHFVKPVTTKAFTGFVLDRTYGAPGLNPHDIEQSHALFKLPGDTAVWVSQPVEWLCEWRFYVQDGVSIGRARYDEDGADDASEPDPDVVQRCIADLSIAHPYALDVGVLSTGQTAIVEVNDAWAVGLYGDALDAKVYLKFLISRWKSIAAKKQ